MPIIFVPGVKASQLYDSYPLDQERVWGRTFRDFVWGGGIDHLELRDGLYDASDERVLEPRGTIGYAYGRAIEHLRSAFGPRVYIFTYDWRKSNDDNARRLERFVRHLEGKLALRQTGERVAFVTHSMGGLVVRSLITLLGGKKAFERIGPLVFVAPPFRGSLDVVRLLVAGEESDGWFGDDESYRKIGRTLPSTYQLIANWPGSVVWKGSGGDVDLFEYGNWQANVQRPGALRPELLERARALRTGRGVRRATREGQEPPVPIAPDRLLARQDEVVVLLTEGAPTFERVEVDAENPANRNWFDFAGMTRTREGDGRVHLRSGALEGAVLGIFRDVGGHGTLLRNSRVYLAVEQALRDPSKVLMMKPRTAGMSAENRRRRYFPVWDGDPASFDHHRP